VPFSRNPLYAGLNSRPRVLCLGSLIHFDRTPRNRRSRTSSDPEGSSDKRCGLCRGLIPVCIMGRILQKRFEGGCTTNLFEVGMRPSTSSGEAKSEIKDCGALRLQIPDCGLRIADCGLRIADFRFKVSLCSVILKN
jgi:hypothetical protein